MSAQSLFFRNKPKKRIADSERAGAFILTNEDGSKDLLYEPQPKQRLYHASTVPNLIMEGRRGTGKSLAIRWDFHMRALAYPGYTYLILRRTMPELRKALALDTLIPTPRGWTTMGALRAGDWVFAPDGLPTRVLWKSEPAIDENGTYRVTFDNGESIVASAGHKWVVSTRMQRRLGTSRVLTTAEIAATTHAEKDGRSNYGVRVSGEWQTGLGVDLPVDPYVLGVWLGDGTKGQGAFTSHDDEIVERVRSAGHTVTERPAHPREYGVAGLQAQLRALGVLGSKHVPDIYFRGSRPQRLALLQGLMDTDGWCRTDGWCAFAQTNERRCISEAVMQLAASLGLKPRWSERPAKLGEKDCGTSFEVGWSGDLAVFGLRRKAVRLLPATRGTTDWHYITACEQIADTVCQCIAVKHPSHQFLVGRTSIPTHNSHLLFINGEMERFRAIYPDACYLKGVSEAHYGNGSVGLYGHCETEQDIEKYLSAQFCAVAFDEITTFQWEMVTKISTSCRVAEDSGLLAIVRGGTNPLGVSAEEVYRYFIAKDITLEEDPEYFPNDWGHLHLVKEDNTYLDNTQYDKRFAGLPEAYRRAWLDGEWGVEGAYFSLQPQHLIDAQPLVSTSFGEHRMMEWPWIHVYRIIDWGFNPDPAVCLWVGVLPNGREIPFMEQLWIRTPAQQVALDIKRASDGMKVVATFADPTLWEGEKEMDHCLADEFEMRGVPLVKAKNDRTAIGFAIQEHLHQILPDGLPRMQILENGKEGCPMLVRSLRSMRVDKRRPGRIADHRHDHLTICLGYFCMAGVGPTNIPTESSIKPWMMPKRKHRIMGLTGHPR